MHEQFLARLMIDAKELSGFGSTYREPEKLQHETKSFGTTIGLAKAIKSYE
jgi:hypothetical protein